MNSRSLARDYLRKAKVRLQALEFYRSAQDYSDVVREAQETVELSLRAILRMIGVEPPKVHDVGSLLKEYADRLPGVPVPDLVRASTRLRKERELAFYGDIDFLPQKQYGEEDAALAIKDATAAVTAALRFAASCGIEEIERQP